MKTALSFNYLYQLNSPVSPQRLANALHACLCKAEALSSLATTADWETYNADTIANYWWALHNIIHEARWLHETALELKAGGQ